MQGYLPEHIAADCAEVVVGNALSRGNAAVEALLDSGCRYISGPQWLAERVLPGRDTLAVAGTHGKTTTTTILAWLLEAAGRAPGFLIGGVPENFGVSARLGGVLSQGVWIRWWRVRCRQLFDRCLSWRRMSTTLHSLISAANSYITVHVWRF